MEEMPPQGVQQKQNTQANQHNGTQGHILAPVYVKQRRSSRRGLCGSRGRSSVGPSKSARCHKSKNVLYRPAFLFGFGDLIGIEEHVEPPEADHGAEYPVNFAGSGNQTGKDRHMDEGPHKLAAIHGPHARNHAQHQRDTGMWRLGIHHARSRWRTLHTGGDAIFAVDETVHLALAVFTQRLAARTAVGDGWSLLMGGAIHAVLLLRCTW